MSKPKPLTKNKIMIVDLKRLEEKIKKEESSLYGKFKYIYVCDVKSAIQGLLQDIEKVQKIAKKLQRKKQKKKIFIPILSLSLEGLDKLIERQIMIVSIQGVYDGLDIAKKLIKKWFKGIIEEVK